MTSTPSAPDGGPGASDHAPVDGSVSPDTEPDTDQAPSEASPSADDPSDRPDQAARERDDRST